MPVSEQGRIEFLIRRDGLEEAIEWVHHTMRIYRRAVLDKRHFASTGEYHRTFIESYCEFKRSLTAMQVCNDSDGTSLP